MATHKVKMLTTKDNPYSYFDDFEKWFAFDTANHYNCCAYLCRVAFFSDSLSDYENDLEQNRAVDDILAHDPNPIYTEEVREWPDGGV